jgi:hypothetical protein
MPSIPVSSPSTYSSATMGSEPYHKLPLTGNANFTPESQALPLQTSMPSVQLSMAASEPHPPMRAQYAYDPTTAAPPMPGSTDSSLSVPRYVDSNPRPSKSPRHSNHQSDHSGSSITNAESAGEYRYGSSYQDVTLGNNSSNATGEIPSPYGQETNAPSRDYYPPSNTWSSTAGGAHGAATYANGESRAYAFPESYKGGGSAPSAALPPPPLPRVSTATAGTSTPVYNNGVSHYSWSTN